MAAVKHVCYHLIDRRNVVLDVLAEQNIISAAEATQAKAAPLGVIPQGRLGISSFPAFIDLVKRQLREDYNEEDLTGEGLRIFTSLDRSKFLFLLLLFCWLSYFFYYNEKWEICRLEILPI